MTMKIRRLLATDIDGALEIVYLNVWSFDLQEYLKLELFKTRICSHQICHQIYWTRKEIEIFASCSAYMDPKSEGAEFKSFAPTKSGSGQIHMGRER